MDGSRSTPLAYTATLATLFFSLNTTASTYDLPTAVGIEPTIQIQISKEIAHQVSADAANQILYQQPALIASSESTLVTQLLNPRSYVFEAESTSPPMPIQSSSRMRVFPMTTTAWILLSALAGLVLVGRHRRHHESPSEQPN